MDIKKRNKREMVREAIHDSINSHALDPGDRLLTIRELSALYEVNEQTTLKALRDLVDEGVLENRPRDGYFVRSNNDKETAASQPHPIDNTTQSANDDFSHIFIPLPRQKTLNIYLSDTYSGQTKKWAEVLDQFKSLHPDTTIRTWTGRDGHIQTLSKQIDFDIIQCETRNSIALQSEGMEFVPPEELEANGISEGELIDCVQAFFEQGHERTGIPQGIGPCFMYVNLDLLKKGGNLIKIPQTPDDLFWPLEHQSQLREAGIATADHKLFQLALFTGALMIKPESKPPIQLDASRLLSTLKKAAESDMVLCGNWTTKATSLFQQGKLPVFFHMGYLAGIHGPSYNFDYEVRPLPDGLVDGQIPDIMELTLNKNSSNPMESLNLLKHLCSLKARRHLASPYCRLSVVKEAIFNKEFLDKYPISEQTIKETLRKIRIPHPFSVDEFNFENNVNNCGTNLCEKRLTIEEAATHIQFIYANLYQSQQACSTQSAQPERSRRHA